MAELLDNFTFLDGSPCGIYVKEDELKTVMPREQKLVVTDLERKAIAFCREKEITLPIANYLVEFAEEAIKEHV